MVGQITRRETLRRGLAAASLLALIPEWAMPAPAEGETDPRNVTRVVARQYDSTCQTLALKEAAKDRYHVLFAVALTTGMRPSEYLALAGRQFQQGYGQRCKNARTDRGRRLALCRNQTCA